ncbi:MAG: hypothetical protein ACOY7J_02655, partial [Pseudomonadota bacterium]
LHADLPRPVFPGNAQNVCHAYRQVTLPENPLFSTTQADISLMGTGSSDSAKSASDPFASVFPASRK